MSRTHQNGTAGGKHGHSAEPAIDKYMLVVCSRTEPEIVQWGEKKRSLAASKCHDSEMESDGKSHTLLKNSTPACLAQQNKLHKTSVR